MTSKKYISFAVIMLGLIAGGIWGVFMTIGRDSTAAQPTAFVAGSETNEKIEKLRTELEKTAEYEVAYGCTENDQFGEIVLCGKSKEKVDKLHDELINEFRKHQIRSPKEVEVVKKNIRSLRSDETLELTFQGTFSNLYAEKSKKKTEDYRDNKGFEYMVDISTNKVIQYGPGGNSRIEFSNTPRLSMKQLQDKAEKYLAKNIPDFDQVKKTFKSESGSKGDENSTSFAFRWNAPAKVNGEDMLPFVQVVMSAGGDIMSFNDTRSLYVQN